MPNGTGDAGGEDVGTPVVRGQLTPAQIAAAMEHLRNPDEHGPPPIPPLDITELLESQAIIEQAKGMLIERYQLDADSAFLFLRRLSQHTNRKLRDIAIELVATGDLPADPTGT